MRIEGGLSDWFETGDEGTFWILEDDVVPGIDGVHIIGIGDHLTVISAEGVVVFEGIIEPNLEVGEAGKRMGRSQPTACGRWVHWIQKGVDSETWGQYFFSNRYRGVLTRIEKSDSI